MINSIKRTALIIGASRGVGREFVRHLLSNNYKVYATARDDDSIVELQNEGAIVYCTDVTVRESLTALSWQLLNNREQLDLVVYVAGVAESFNGATIPPTKESFDATMHVNVLGAMQSIPLIAPLVTPFSGKFIFMSSRLGSITEADSSVCWIYRASKAALNMAVFSAKHDYPNIIFATMHPGWVKTDMGGPGATMSTMKSVVSMMNVIDKLGLSDSGSFLNYDGRRMGW